MKNHHHRRRRRHRVHTKLFLSLSERHFIPKCSLSLCPPQTLSLIYTYLLPIFVSVILVSVSYLHWILLCLIHTTYFSTYTFTFIPSLSHPPTYYPFHLYSNIFVFLSVVLSIYPFIYQSSYPSVYLFIFQSIYTLIYLYCYLIFLQIHAYTWIVNVWSSLIDLSLSLSLSLSQSFIFCLFIVSSAFFFPWKKLFSSAQKIKFLHQIEFRNWNTSKEYLIKNVFGKDKVWFSFRRCRFPYPRVVKIILLWRTFLTTDRISNYNCLTNSTYL